MKKNKTKNSGIDAKMVVEVAATCAAVAVALAPVPPVIKGVVLGTSVPTWLRGHIFF